MSPHRSARAVRGVGVASIATFVALMGHVAGGGAMPGWLGLVAPFALASAVSTLVVGAKRSLAGLSVAVVLSQVLFHVLFTLGAPAVSAPTLTPHHHGGDVMLSMGTASGLHDHGTPSMTAMHLVAAVLTILAIRYAERAVAVAARATAGVLRWMSRLLTRISIAPRVMNARRLEVSGDVWRPAARSLWASISRRGPPVLFSA